MKYGVIPILGIVLLVGLSANPYSMNGLASGPVVYEAYAESTKMVKVERGDTWEKQIHADGLVVHTLGKPEWIETQNGYVPFVLQTIPNGYRYSSNSISFDITTTSCSAKIYEKGIITGSSDVVIPSLKYSLKETPQGQNNWSALPINSETCSISYQQTQDGITFTTTQDRFENRIQNGIIQNIQVGRLQTQWVASDGKGLETIATYENLDPLKDNTHRYGFDEVMPFTGITKVNGVQTSNISTEDIQKGIILEKDGHQLNYQNSQDFQYHLNSAVLSTSIINDYKNVDTPLPKGGKVTLDPTYSYTAGTNVGVKSTDCAGGGLSSPTGDGEYWIGRNGGTTCYRHLAYFDITSIPDNTLSIDDTDIRYDVTYKDAVQVSGNWVSIAGQGSTMSASDLWSQISGSSTSYVSGDTNVATVANDYLLDLGTNADADLLAELSVDNEWSVGIYGTNEASVSTTVVTNIELQVVYSIPIVPNAPTNDGVTNGTSLTYDWTFGTNFDNATQPAITTTTVYVADSEVSTFSFLANVTAPTTTYEHTGLDPFTTQCFKVSAWNSAGASTNSTIKCGLTTPPVPTAPTNLTVDDISISRLDLDWDDAPSYDNVIGYRIFRESPVDNGWAILVNDTGTTTSSYSNTGLSTKTQYNYMVAGWNASGIGDNSTASSAYTWGLPDAVTGFSIINPTTTTLTLNWTAPVEYGYPVTGYKIERESPVGGGFSTLVADTATTTTSYTDTELTLSTQYNYRVTPISSFGNGASATASSYTSLGAPTIIDVNDCYHTCTTQLNIEWTAPSPSTGLNGYKIERESPVDGGWSVLVANTTTTTTYYNNTGLTAGTTYNYRVSALSNGVASSASNEYDYSPHKLPDAVTDLVATTSTFVDVLLEWTEPTLYGTLSGYMINYTTPAGDPLTVITNDTESTSTSYTIVGLSTTEEYSFRVSPVTVHGTNGTGNISNATAVENFEIGNINLPTGSNTNTAEDITYTLTVINSTASTLTVQYPNDFDLACDFSYKFARNNQTYTGMTGTTVDATYDSTDFDFYGVDNEIIDVTCWDQNDSTNSADYLITQNSFPLLDQINNFRNGTYGTMGMFGVIDFITLAVIIFSMMGFNQVNEAVGVMFNIMLVGALAFFGIIELPTVVFGAIAVVVMFAITSTRKT